MTTKYSLLSMNFICFRVQEFFFPLPDFFWNQFSVVLLDIFNNPLRIVVAVAAIKWGFLGDWNAYIRISEWRSNWANWCWKWSILNVDLSRGFQLISFGDDTLQTRDTEGICMGDYLLGKSSEYNDGFFLFFKNENENVPLKSGNQKINWIYFIRIALV